MSQIEPAPSNGSDEYLCDQDRTDVVIYTQGWGVDSPPEPGAPTNALVRSRVFINGREVERAIDATVKTGAGFTEVVITMSPTSLRFETLTQLEWANLTSAEVTSA